MLVEVLPKFVAGRLMLCGLGHGIVMDRGLGFFTSLVGVLSDRKADWVSCQYALGYECFMLCCGGKGVCFFKSVVLGKLYLQVSSFASVDRSIWPVEVNLVRNSSAIASILSFTFSSEMSRLEG